MVKSKLEALSFLNDQTMRLLSINLQRSQVNCPRCSHAALCNICSAPSVARDVFIKWITGNNWPLIYTCHKCSACEKNSSRTTGDDGKISVDSSFFGKLKAIATCWIPCYRSSWFSISNGFILLFFLKKNVSKWICEKMFGIEVVRIQLTPFDRHRLEIGSLAIILMINVIQFRRTFEQYLVCAPS